MKPNGSKIKECNLLNAIKYSKIIGKIYWKGKFPPELDPRTTYYWENKNGNNKRKKMV